MATIQGAKIINMVIIFILFIVTVFLSTVTYGFLLSLGLVFLVFFVSAITNGLLEQYDAEVRGDVVNASLRGAIVGGIGLLSFNIALFVIGFLGGVLLG